MPSEVDSGVCNDFMTYYPLSNFIPGVPGENGILLLISGLLNIFFSIVTIIWIKNNEFQAQNEDGKDEAVQSVIFPVFVKVLWISAIINVYAGLVTAMVPTHPAASDHTAGAYFESFNYAAMRTLQHCVVEGINLTSYCLRLLICFPGIAFLLMQKGCGKYATKKALFYTFIWGIITFIVMLLGFTVGSFIYDLLNEIWNLALLLFYIVLWTAPQKRLFRRPAAIKYAQFWTLFRLIILFINCGFMFRVTFGAANCGYIFVNLIILAIAQPIICYWTLLQDSRWWQGIDIYQGTRRESNEGIRSPLMGTEFDIFSAQSLALTMDSIRVKGQVKMLNFASLKLDTRKMLGAGSFSKVYKGTYRGKECAIKLIYTADLTADIIMRVAAEASILSSIRHPNIVHILGLSVLPPSVCLILEICNFGSLSDVIRGYGYDWNTTHRSPLTVSRTDGIYLALGCARGLAAVHSFDSSICHRDVKSFNFLVDSQFNVKIADLELGIASRLNHSTTSSGVGLSGETNQECSGGNGNNEHESMLNSTNNNNTDPYESFVVENLLANWLAPEVLIERKFTQPSDIYSLGTVLWEIISKQLPFANDMQGVIHQKIREGYRHPIPLEYHNTPMAHLIQSCWCENPLKRPSGAEIVLQLEHILDNECYTYVKDIEGGASLKTHVLVEFYESYYRKQSSSQRISDYIGSRSDRNAEGNSSSSSMGWKSLFGYSSIPGKEDSDEPLQTPVKSDSSTNIDLLLSGVNNDSFDDTLALGDPSSLSFASRNSASPSPYAGPHTPSTNYSGRYYSPLDRSSQKSEHIPTHSSSMSSTGNGNDRLKLTPQLPKAALDTIALVKEETYWRNLEKHGGCWAVVTSQAPHVIMHATTAWYHLFKLNPLTSSYSKLESLVSLVEAFNTENNSKNVKNYNSSNVYVNEQNNILENNKTFKRVLRDIKMNKQIHNILSFHVNNGFQHYSASNHSLKGYNMMCTVHGYPVYSINQYSYSDSVTTEYAGNSSTYRKQSSESMPIYYAMLFNELREHDSVAPEFNLGGERLSVSGGSFDSNTLGSGVNKKLSFTSTLKNIVTGGGGGSFSGNGSGNNSNSNLSSSYTPNTATDSRATNLLGRFWSLTDLSNKRTTDNQNSQIDSKSSVYFLSNVVGVDGNDSDSSGRAHSYA